MKDRRLQIKEALESMIDAQRAVEFQRLAVHLAKTKWPELEATHEQADRGEDATSFSVGRDGLRRRLACSLTGTLGKVRQDATRLRERGVRLDVLVFATAASVTHRRASEWRERVKEEFGHDLHVISQAEIVALLEHPGNTWLCRGYLHLDFTDEPEFAELEAAAKRAASRIVGAWKAEYRYEERQPIELTLTHQARRSPVKDVSEPQRNQVALNQVANLIGERKRVVLAGPPGAGKTFTLIQLADLLLQDTGAAIPILISLPGWASSGCELLAYLERQLGAHGLDSQGLSKLNAAGRLALLLNGWNEIAADVVADAGNRLRAFALNTPGAPFVVSTRATRLAPPLSQQVVVHVEPLSGEQKVAVIQRSGLSDSSKLIRALQTNPTLADVTDTPLFLAAVIDLARYGKRIPATRFGILESVIEHTESSPEHLAPLNGAPCAGFHRRHLENTAGAMTQAGATTLPSEDLLRIIADCSKTLQSEGHLASVPNSTAIADCLVKHHVLVFSPSSGGAYRFIHQQFQEWFAAEWLHRRVAALAEDEHRDEVFGIQRDVLNHTQWQEPLAFLIERLEEGGDEQHRVAAKLIRWAMPVDLLAAAGLAGIAGERIWPLIRDELSGALRRWYARNSEHHRQCALAAMLATGAPDFQDILWPLIESDDQEAQLWTWMTWRPLPLTSLGPNWRSRLGRWNERQRAKFVHALCWHASQAHISLATDLAKTDRSPKVKLACLDVLEEAGAYDTLVGILADPAFGEWTKDIYEKVLPRLPDRYLGRFIPQMMAALDGTQELSTRSAILDTLRAAGHPDWLELSKAEMNRLVATPGVSLRPTSDPPSSARSGTGEVNATPYLARSLKAVHNVAPKWAVDWLAGHLMQGQFWWEPFADYLTKMPDDLLEKLAPVALDATLEINTARKRAARFASSGSQVAARALLKEHLAFSTQRKNQRLASGYNRGDALEAAIRELSLPCLVDAILYEAGNTADFDELRALVELVTPSSPLDWELGSQLSGDRKESLRLLAFRIETLKPAQLGDAARSRALLAALVGGVGKPEDAKLIESWIGEERTRRHDQEAEWQEGLQAWKATGRRSEHPGPRDITVYWNWYLGALAQLNCPESAEVLLRLLRDPELLGEAAWWLVRLGRADSQEVRSAFGLRPQYAEIYERQQSREIPDKGLTGAAKRHADAIFEAIQVFLSELERGNSERLERGLVTAATALAGLNDVRAIRLLLKLSSMQYSGWAIAEAFHGLVLRGIVVPGKEIAEALGPFMAEHEQWPRSSNHDGWYAAVQCLAVLLFSDRPVLGVERIRLLPPSRLKSYNAREVLGLLGACRAPEAADLLVELSDVPEIRGHRFCELTRALSQNVNPRARHRLLSLLDESLRGERPLCHDGIALLAEALANVVRADERIWSEVKSRCKSARSVVEARVLSRVLFEVGTDDAAIALCDVLHDEFPVPSYMERLVEEVAQHKVPAGGAGFYQLESRETTDLRKRLIGIAQDDPTRRNSALELLATIADCRLEHGMAAKEPLHPDIELLKRSPMPWPLLD